MRRSNRGPKGEGRARRKDLNEINGQLTHGRTREGG